MNMTKKKYGFIKFYVNIYYRVIIFCSRIAITTANKKNSKPDFFCYFIVLINLETIEFICCYKYILFLPKKINRSSFGRTVIHIREKYNSAWIIRIIKTNTPPSNNPAPSNWKGINTNQFVINSIVNCKY